MKYLTSDSLNSLLKPFSGWFDAGSSIMKTDVRSDDKEYTLSIELPGIDKQNINIALEDGYLTVEAVRNHEETEKDEKSNYVFRERNLRQNVENLLRGRRNPRRKYQSEIRQRYFDGGRPQIQGRRKTPQENCRRINPSFHLQTFLIYEKETRLRAVPLFYRLAIFIFLFPTSRSSCP